MNIGIRTFNPFGLHRETWPATTLRRRRSSLLHTVEGQEGEARPVLQAAPPMPAAAVDSLPLTRTHADEAREWGLRSVVHSLRHKAVPKLAKLDRKLVKTAAPWPHASEQERLAAEDLAEARAVRKAFSAAEKGNEHDLEHRRHRIRNAIITGGLIVFDGSVMIQPWHLFGAPSLPGLSQHQNDVGSFVAIGRAFLLSAALVLLVKRAGAELRGRVGKNVLGGRIVDVAMLLSVLVTTLLLLRSTSELQEAYIALASGGSQTALPAGVFMAVLLFVVSASLATGYWSTSMVAERFGRLVSAEQRREKTWSKRAKRLDKIVGKAAWLSRKREHILRSLTEMEREQVALAVMEGRLVRDANWMLYGLEPQPQKTPAEGEVAGAGHVTDLAIDTGAFEPEPPVRVTLDASQLMFPREPRFADDAERPSANQPVPASLDVTALETLAKKNGHGVHA